MLITSLQNNHIKDLRKLKEKKHRDKENLFLIEGRHLVLEAYKRNLVKELILEKDEVFPLSLKTTYVTKEILNSLSSLESPSNIMAVVSKKEEGPLGSKILILDNIQDPGNVGTIIRSAVAFNIDTIVLSKNTVDLYNDKVIRASQGMLFHINIIVRDIEEFIDELKSKHYLIVGTKVTHGKDVRDAKIYDNYALIMGNEGTGIEMEILNKCDEYLYIKMNEDCESLNVGVATSILLYELNNK